jgi:hypothetical protein
MPESSGEAARLRRDVESAFAGAPYPGDRALIEPHCPECEGFSAAFRGKRWNEHKDAPLVLLGPERQEAFAFFTPEAFHHYLPLALLACLEHYDQADLLPQAMVFRLGAGDPSWREKRLALLNPAELRAAAGVLRHMKRAHPADFGEGRLAQQLDAAVDELEKRLSR